MSRPEAPRGLLATIPSGALLSGLLRLVLPGDRAEEFLGDLVEEAHLRRKREPSMVAAWLWSQTLRSVPALVGLRIRRFVTRSEAMSTSNGLLLGSRSGQRSWALSLVVSISGHALLLAATFAWVFARVEEVQPPRPPLTVSVFSPQPAPAPPFPALVVRQPPRVRQLRPTRRPSIVTAAALDTAAAARATDAPVSTTAVIVDPPLIGSGLPRPAPQVRLPPRVAEKRCLSCPAPQLPEPYARIGLAQEIRVKTCVGMDGNVTSVDVVNGFDSTVDAHVIDTLRSWRLTPYLVDGHPVPFCYGTQFVFARQ